MEQPSSRMRLPDGARDGSLEVVQLEHAPISEIGIVNLTAVCPLTPQTLSFAKRSKTPQGADRTRLASDSDHPVDLAFSSIPLTEDLESPPAPIFTQDAALRLTTALSSSIRSSDLAFLQSLLFSPRIPASSPSALYQCPSRCSSTLLTPKAGAQYSIVWQHEALQLKFWTHSTVPAPIFLSLRETPLHILACSIYDPSFTYSLRRFILHLIQHLRAHCLLVIKMTKPPLNIAADHGHSVGILLALLHCDGLLSSLRATCPSINHSADAAHIPQLEDCVGEANDQCNAIVIHSRGRIGEASRMVQELQGNTDQIGSLRNAMQIAARGKFLVRELTPLPSRWRNKDSEDSQATYVCHDNYSDTASSIQASASFTPRGHISQATQTALLDQFGAKPAYPCSPAKTDPSDHSKSSKTEQTYFEELCEVDRELSLLQEMYHMRRYRSFRRA
ncbi:hypothetical protein CPB83DRAFT_900617 [Crepidotus variabilis]|uniref:Uncharacterized protein n=1 Tax=Crepidotus variabilis TaxID=179855 RepID=A0A9P6E2X0_9AGAR|nr:hypothetical protein CPB83DRAFT_900617 [Crepidotus variabilis]